LLDVLMQHKTLGYFGSVINQLKFYQTKTWTNKTEFQPTIERADRDKNQEPDRLVVGHFEATRHEIKGVASIGASINRKKLNGFNRNPF
jgi:hypothetical protein